MPAMVCHWLLGKRVTEDARKIAGEDFFEDSFMLGCQGPDMLFYHRMLNPFRKRDLQKYGYRIHTDHPSAFFAVLKSAVLDSGELYGRALSYALGMCCHYAYDTCTHPFVCQLEDQMRHSDERGENYHYHALIESALDVIMLRHETGGLISDLNLRRCARHDKQDRLAVAHIYSRVLRELYGVETDRANLLRLLPDMHRLFALLYDPTGIWRPIVAGAEHLIGVNSGRMSAFMRPFMEDDSYDYANIAHEEWQNIMNSEEKSCEDFFEMTDRAQAASAEMMRFFMQNNSAVEFARFTGERSFSNNVDEGAARRDDCVI